MVRSCSSSHVAEGGRLGHRRRDRAVDAQHDAGVLQPEEQVVQRGRCPGRLHHVGDHAEVDRRDRAGSRARFSIHGSRGRTQQIASGSTPRASSQMQASVAVLPEPDDDVLARRLLQPHEVVDRDHPRAVGDAERAAASPPGCRGRGSARRRSGTAPAPRTARRRSRETKVRSPTYSQPGKNSTLPDAEHPVGQQRRRSRRRSSAGRPARAAPPRARAPASARRRAASTRRRRRRRTGAGARTGRPPASARRRRARRSTRATRTSAWSISASVNAMPMAPAPTTR